MIPAVFRPMAAGLLPLLCVSCATRTGPVPPAYLVRRAPAPPSLQGLWDEPAWRAANVLAVDQFAAGRGGSHRPVTRARLTYTDEGLYVFFRVADRFVLSRQSGFQAAVYRDSCVEFFVQPKPDRGYFNFEMNAGGALLLTYIEDPTRTASGFKRFTRLPVAADAAVRRFHSLPSVVWPERAGPVDWCVEYFIPFALLEPYVGPLGCVSGQTWRANCFKCADDSSQPHWAAWAPLDADFAGGFHRPDRFAEIRFE